VKKQTTDDGDDRQISGSDRMETRLLAKTMQTRTSLLVLSALVGAGCQRYYTATTVRDPSQVEVAFGNVRLTADREPSQKRVTVQTLHPEGNAMVPATAPASPTNESATLERAADGSISFHCPTCSVNQHVVFLDKTGLLITSEQRSVAVLSTHYRPRLVFRTGQVFDVYQSGGAKSVYGANVTESFEVSTPWTNVREIHRRAFVEPVTGWVYVLGSLAFVAGGAAVIIAGPDEHKYAPGTKAYDRSRIALDILGVTMIAAGAVFGWMGWRYLQPNDELLYRSAEP
jgi:hypothetical protein